MDTDPQTASPNLLARIMRRFGLERQLIRIRRNLGTSLAFFSITFAGTFAAAIVLRAALRRSAFLPYAMLVRSDFHFVVRHRGSFLSAMFESAPTAFISLVLFAAAGLLICLRLAVVYWRRMSRVSTSIHNN